jgi:hypothetical protein
MNTTGNRLLAAARAIELDIHRSAQSNAPATIAFAERIEERVKGLEDELRNTKHTTPEETAQLRDARDILDRTCARVSDWEARVGNSSRKARLDFEPDIGATFVPSAAKAIELANREGRPINWGWNGTLMTTAPGSHVLDAEIQLNQRRPMTEAFGFLQGTIGAHSSRANAIVQRSETSVANARELAMSRAASPQQSVRPNREMLADLRSAVDAGAYPSLTAAGVATLRHPAEICGFLLHLLANPPSPSWTTTALENLRRFATEGHVRHGSRDMWLTELARFS